VTKRCYFFGRTVCGNGSDCPFVHDVNYVREKKVHKRKKKVPAPLISGSDSAESTLSTDEQKKIVVDSAQASAQPIQNENEGKKSKQQKQPNQLPSEKPKQQKQPKQQQNQLPSVKQGKQMRPKQLQQQQPPQIQQQQQEIPKQPQEPQPQPQAPNRNGPVIEHTFNGMCYYDYNVTLPTPFESLSFPSLQLSSFPQPVSIATPHPPIMVFLILSIHLIDHRLSVFNFFK
jgi:flagellar motor protein MotB